MAPKMKQESPDTRDRSKRARIDSPPSAPRRTALNPLDCNLDFTVESDGITGSALHGAGFAYCWSGARASFGIKGGKYCFGCRVLENQQVVMEDTAKGQQHVCRVGLSRGDSDVGSLGESSASFGYGGTGKFSHAGSFTDYGGAFGVGDLIICAIDLQDPIRAKVSFAKNGKWLGVAYEFDASSKGLDIVGAPDYDKALFPHILLKNVKVRLLLSVDHGLQPLEGFKAWDSAIGNGNAVWGPEASAKGDCEVIMMVGLPGAGKTTWAQNWAKDHPEKRYMLLGTNLALDQMKVPGLLRKRNYGERFELLMDRATKIFNQLLDRASKTSRNFIIDQTNVYRNARIRKLKSFRNLYKIAVVIFPNSEELKRRTRARAQEMGKEVPEEAVREMIVNFVLPNTKDMLNSVEPFDEVRFAELQREDADRHLQDMKNNLPTKRGETKNDFPGKKPLFQGSPSAALVSSPSGQGKARTSPFMLQNRREAPPVPHRASPQVPAAAYESLPYQSPYGTPSNYSQGVANLRSRQANFPSHYSRESSVSSFNSDGGYYGREISSPFHLGIHPSPLQGYGSVGGSLGPGAQNFHLGEGSPDVFARNRNRYGDPHFPSSGVERDPYYRY